MDRPLQLMELQHCSPFQFTNRSKYKKKPSLERLQNYFEYVFFNEDLLSKLFEILRLEDESLSSLDLTYRINFRCMVSVRGNVFLC